MEKREKKGVCSSIYLLRVVIHPTINKKYMYICP